MITIIYPFKNRELQRIKRSLDSLVNQSNKDFDVVFVDYGSDFEIAASVKELLKQYEFVRYIYSFHNNQPWSRAKAINIGIRFVETEYVFIADIDIIFNKRFVDVLFELQNKKENVYFQVGYLDKHESVEIKEFDLYTIASKSIPEGQGLSLFKLDSLLKVGGFDEFFHFWGAEDEDVHLRLQEAGFSSKFYNNEILLLHQWHKIFETFDNNKLSSEPRLSDVFNLNKQKLRFNQKNHIEKPNNENWGKLITEKEFQFLDSNDQSIVLLNKKHVVENFLDIILPKTNAEIINVIFQEDPYQLTLKYKIKKLLRIKTQEYYSLKQINDMLLKVLVIYYQDYLYNYKISSDLKSIQLKISK
ncbi:GT2 family glycosyltransferase [Flavobacterium sp. 90]|uniref:glycosyltransferase family 2 protein n=1 Tax=unclassified Flavobacterium TaxID=196869 RepID=UPI000EB3EB12|nr:MULTISPECIES: glycosyltransferase [unclassified Flavobacterium]RKR10937.1 GT2 family glycosyltransferase [Flavobacterium sp. 81]TCK54721.1 GT2 family glycosyltransferase [Flavobacterium sp. 90]